jgi:putative colanic acid biosynthesis acetyltransferase WcaF
MIRTSGLDVNANRGARKYGMRVQVARVLWGLATFVFRLSPRPLWGWRRVLLRAFGARIGAEVHVYPTARITMPWNIEIGELAAVGDNAIIYALGAIRIGARATISQGAHLCAGTHDWRNPEMPLLTPPITIGEQVWICADAFIGPGVSIGDRAIVGARAVAMRSVPADAIVVGNPAAVVSSRTSEERSD